MQMGRAGSTVRVCTYGGDAAVWVYAVDIPVLLLLPAPQVDCVQGVLFKPVRQSKAFGKILVNCTLQEHRHEGRAAPLTVRRQWAEHAAVQ
jgi:hypothetical protein